MDELNQNQSNQSPLSTLVGDTGIFQHVFLNNPEPMWVIEASSLKFVAVNDAAVRLYQYSREEFLEMTLFDIRRDRESLRLSEYAESMRRSPVLPHEGTCDRWLHVKKDGTQFEIEVTWAPVSFNGKQYVISTLRGVTSALKTSDQLILQRNALSQVTDAVFAVDNSRRVNYWNEAAANLYGYSSEEVQGKKIEDVIQYAYLSTEEHQQAMDALQNGGYWRGEKFHTTKDGRKLYVDTLVTTLRNASGGVMGLMAVSRDISEKKKFQKQLIETNEKLAAIIKASPVAIICHDLDGRVQVWNRAAEKIFGWTESEIIGKEYLKLVPKESREEHQQLQEDALKGKAREGREIIRHSKTGTPVYLRASGAPLKNADGNVVGVLVLMSDISSQKLIENELRKAKEVAVAANKTKSEFVANISHELRTPLGAILGFAEMMFDSKQTVTERIKCISRIRHNVQNLTELIDDLLDLSKVEAGHFDVEITRFALLEQLSNTLNLLQSQALRKRIGITVSFEGSIPLHVYTDPSRLRQILLNVLGNALKFTQRGTVSLTISCEKENNDYTLRFRVKDTGIGILPNHVDRIFHPFAQIDSSVTRQFGGTGLGLNLSRQLAKILGGDVTLVQSTPNVGSTFEITIDPGDLSGVRFSDQLTAKNLVSAPPKTPTTFHENLKGMRVLLVEDGQDNQYLISHFLKSSGARVDLAVNGLKGIEMAQKTPYDVILMDIQMPILDGYQATRTLRNRGSDTPIVALTAHAMKGEKQRCMDVGCNSYLSKPVDAHTLVKTVARYAAPQAP